MIIDPPSSCSSLPPDPLCGATRWAHGNALTLSGQGERRRNACNRRRHHLTPLRLTLLFSFSELSPVSCADWSFSRLFFLRDSLSGAKWAKKCQRFPKSLWVSADADHLQPCVHAGTISACMRFRAKPSWTNPIKPFHWLAVAQTQFSLLHLLEQWKHQLHIKPCVDSLVYSLNYSRFTSFSKW